MGGAAPVWGVPISGAIGDGLGGEHGHHVGWAGQLNLEYKERVAGCLHGKCAMAGWAVALLPLLTVHSAAAPMSGHDNTSCELGGGHPEHHAKRTHMQAVHARMLHMLSSPALCGRCHSFL